MKHDHKHLFALILSTFFILGFTTSVSAQQTFVYSQFMHNLTPYNSAYSVVNQTANINLSARLQWAGIEGAPTSFMLNGSLPFEKINASGGLVVTQDKFAVENQTTASFFFAKAVQIASKGFLALSLNAGFQNFKADYSQLDPSDPQFRNNLSGSGATAGAGLLFYQPDKFYAGVSIPAYTLGGSGETSTRMKNTFYATAGFIQDLGDSIMIKPAILVGMTKNIPATADISTTLYLKNVGIGVSYRTTNEISGILSYLYNNFRIGYSYQAGLGTNNIANVSSGTHELSLGLYFGKKQTRFHL